MRDHWDMSVTSLWVCVLIFFISLSYQGWHNCNKLEKQVEVLNQTVFNLSTQISNQSIEYLNTSGLLK